MLSMPGTTASTTGEFSRASTSATAVVTPTTARTTRVAVHFAKAVVELKEEGAQDGENA
jgi:hypothetical protein